MTQESFLLKVVTFYNEGNGLIVVPFILFLFNECHTKMVLWFSYLPLCRLQRYSRRQVTGSQVGLESFGSERESRDKSRLHFIFISPIPWLLLCGFCPHTYNTIQNDAFVRYFGYILQEILWTRWKLKVQLYVRHGKDRSITGVSLHWNRISQIYVLGVHE